jgi:hypothetical protein
MNRVVGVMLVLATVMVAGVSQGASVDFADQYVSSDAAGKAKLDKQVVKWVGAETAATLKTNGYIHAEMIGAAMAASKVNAVRQLVHPNYYTTGPDYYGQVATGITNGVMTYTQVGNLLWVVTPDTAARQAAYTWVVANHTSSSTRTQLTREMYARGDTEFSLEDQVELISVNEHDDKAKSRILTAMVPKVRAKMRAEGESFVGAAGRSNVLARLEVIVAQLNGGSGNGFEATLRAHGVACPDKARTKMDARAARLLPKIMDGEVIPNRKQLQLLQTVLGAVEYEKWRNAYNDGSSYTM